MTEEADHWSYERQPRFDQSGRRWHFVSRSMLGSEVSYEERPFELYFRDDDRTQFGLLRFDRRKDNPYRNYDTMVTKIMNDPEFRQALLAPETSGVWKRSWK